MTKILLFIIALLLSCLLSAILNYYLGPYSIVLSAPISFLLGWKLPIDGERLINKLFKVK